MSLCHQAAFGTGQRAVMPCGWEGNRRSGVAQTSVVYPPAGSRKGDKHTIYTPHGAGHTLPSIGWGHGSSLGEGARLEVSGPRRNIVIVRSAATANPYCMLSSVATPVAMAVVVIVTVILRGHTHTHTHTFNGPLSGTTG